MPISIRGLGFKSANDCPHRDPDEVTIFYTNEHGESVNFATYKLEFQDRWETLSVNGFAITSKQLIFYFRNSKANEIQLGEIIFYTH